MKELRRQTGLPRFGQPRRRGRGRRDPLPPSLRPRAARAEPVATGRWPFPRRGAAWPWAELASILAHLGVLALLLWQGQGGRPEDAPLPPPAVDIVFESGQPEPQATGAPEGDEPMAVEPPARAEAPPPAPEPSVTPPPPTPPAPPEPPRLAEPPPPPIPQPPAPPRIAAAPPPPAPPLASLPQPPAIQAPPPEPALADLPPRPVEPVPRLSAEIPPAEIPPDLLAPQTPLALTQPRIQPTPRPEPRPRPTQQAQPAPRLPGLYLPEGPTFSQARPTPGRPLSPRAPLDLAVAPRLLEGRASADPSVVVRGAQVGPNWNAAFRRWLDQNLRYPIRAIEEGDSGTVRVRVTARPDGTVTGVRLTGASVSPWLNSGTTRPFPGATLPAFPPGADPNGVEIDLTVNYILIRR